jgi:uncharacterized protein YacL
MNQPASSFNKTLALVLGALPALALAQFGLFLAPEAVPLLLLILWPLSSFVLLSVSKEAEPEAQKQDPQSLLQPWILDSSIFIDGRLLELVKLDLASAPFIIPDFVLSELQHLADRSDKNRRQRGRRGLDIAGQMQKLCSQRWTILPSDSPSEQSVDEQLLALTQHLNGRLVSVDKGLVDRAKASGLDTFNMHDCARLLQAPVTPGQLWTLKIIRKGGSKKQGVGYLDDGTMVVVENAMDHIGEQLEVEVTSIIKTRNGPMIFARPGQKKDQRDD